VKFPTFCSLGDRLLIIEFGDSAHPLITERIASLVNHWRENPLKGVLNVIPSVCGIGVFYEPEVWFDFKSSSTPYDNLKCRIKEEIESVPTELRSDPKLMEIPVVYGQEYGEDFNEMSSASGLKENEFIRLHSDDIYIVYMIGFVPGFAYLGPLNPRLNFPRRKTPRLKVPKGSVAIASQMTGIYPGEYPGGWNLIGRTPTTMFDFADQKGSKLKIGDRVRFKPITKNEFLNIVDTS